MLYWFPTGFESTRGYWTDHFLNHKQSLQIVSDRFSNIQCYYILTEHQPKLQIYLSRQKFKTI